MPNEDPAPTVWAAVIDGKTMPLPDLPARAVGEIARECDEMGWFVLCSEPTTRLVAGQKLVELAAREMGVPVPKISTVRDLRKVLRNVEDPNHVDIESPAKGPLEDPQWAVLLPGAAPIQIRDFTIATLERITKARNLKADVVFVLPTHDLLVACDLIDAAAKRLEMEAPPVTPRTVFSFFVQVEDDLPEEYDEGVPRSGGD